MALDITRSIEIIETMENYIESVRPPEEIRHKIDIGYEITNQSVIVHEIRPDWKDPNTIRKFGYAKATFVQRKNSWNVFWKRADGKWHGYKPFPVVPSLKDFLALVQEDKHNCFKG